MSAVAEQSEIFSEGMLGGQVALVTGGGTGLGRQTALELARCGATVTITGRRAEVLEQTAAELAGAGMAVDWLAGDVRDGDQAQATGGGRAGAPRRAGPAGEQRGRTVLQPGGADREQGLAGGVAAERARAC